MRRPAATAALLLLCFVRGDEGRRRLRSPIYMQRHGSDAQAQLRTKGSASVMVQGSARPSELMLQDPTFFDRYYRGYSDRDAACTPRPAPQSPLRWHHISKTGQSFVFTILRWGCPSISLRAVADLARQRTPPRTPSRSFAWLRKICSCARGVINRGSCSRSQGMSRCSAATPVGS